MVNTLNCIKCSLGIISNYCKEAFLLVAAGFSLRLPIFISKKFGRIFHEVTWPFAMMRNWIKMINLKPPKFWYKKNIISYGLLLFSFLYILICILHRWFCEIFYKYRSPVPVIVVGNITVGGTGKTPLVIYLAKFLQELGFRPGIISRGYGGNSKNYPLSLDANSKVTDTGDEALLLLRLSQCPVVVGPDRNASIKLILQKNNCNIIISDDGLQHHKLKADIRIALIDATVGLGNGFCLPAGPLREPVDRLKLVDFVIKNYNTNINNDDFGMSLEPVVFYNLKDTNLTKQAIYFKDKTIHAVAGIGNPLRFFQTLRQLGLSIIEHAFPDHYSFKKSDFPFAKEVVIITEKDAVKCDAIIDSSFWCLNVQAKLSNKLKELLLNKINKI